MPLSPHTAMQVHSLDETLFTLLLFCISTIIHQMFDTLTTEE